MQLSPLKLFAFVALSVAAAAALGFVANAWLTDQQPSPSIAMSDSAPPASAVDLQDKVIVGEQAQKNLRLTARPLQSQTYWKTITLPGMIIDRPGISERAVVAPAVGAVQQILHIPGDTVRPGDVLFTLRLASESLHESQARLYQASHEITLAEARLQRLRKAGEGVAQARAIEVEQEIARLTAAAKAYREDLLRRGLTTNDISGIAEGKLVSEVSVRVPEISAAALRRVDGTPEGGAALAKDSFTFEIRQLAVEVGQQVEAGQTLCDLVNHKLLAIEGRAFRDEEALLEQSVREAWPVEVDFQDVAADWPPHDTAVPISYIASNVDPVTRTFSFLMPLTNQSKTVEHDGAAQQLWRFRTGQRVLLKIRVEKMAGVFVLPAEAIAAEGPETFVFTQNVNLFERKPVHVLHRDRERAVIADDGSLPAYTKGDSRWTIPAVVQTAAAQLDRMTKAGSSDVPKGMHVHADGSLHKNEDEGK